MAREISGNWDIVSISNLGRFISEALTFIEQNPSWLEESGFIPSIYWYTQAQLSYLTSPSVVEMAFYWVCMEVVASTYIDESGLGITNKKERVNRFIRDRGYTGGNWDFLNGVVDDWYQTRNALFHEGKQLLSVEVLKKRRQQVRDFVSLVLVEMLQRQQETRKVELANQIRGYALVN